jgi:flavin-dependent dehydrogenase
MEREDLVEPDRPHHPVRPRVTAQRPSPGKTFAMARSDATCEYAVVGAGPAGSLAARTLAARGRDVVLFDWRPRDEKPCGGGVPARGMARFGELVAGVARNDVTAIRLVGPRGDEASVPLATPLAIFARRDFDEALRRRAVEAGARREAARVTEIERDGDGFRLRFRRGAAAPIESLHACFVVAADGALGSARRRLLELAGRRVPTPDHFSRSHTIYPQLTATSARRDVMEIAYGDADGYGWTFPRTDHASIGWCMQGAGDGDGDLRRDLEKLIAAGSLSGRLGEPGVGALIPSFRGEVAAGAPVEGGRFALIGDAAGAVDPITREGIHHAMASGAGLGETDPLENPGRYAAWYDAELRPELVAAANMTTRFFTTSFLTTMVRALQKSEALREVFRDLVGGTQSYTALRRRLLASLPRSLAALFVAALAP